MVLHRTLTQGNKKTSGFTIIEVLISLALVSLIFSLGMFFSTDLYRGFSVSSERNKVLSILQRVRGQSMSNINQTRHGLRFDDISGIKYIIFECPTGLGCNEFSDDYIHYEIDSSYEIGIDSPVLPIDIIFEQISGDCVETTTFDCREENPLVISGSSNKYEIRINKQGRIDW